MRIIVDAFGGDNAPGEIIKGCVEAVSELRQEIVLVGREAIINDVIDRAGYSRKGLYICDAPDIITMEDEPTDIIKSLKNSSMAVGLKLLADGGGDAFVSAGNTGALTVGATFIVKRSKGVKRAAIGTVIPTFGAGPVLLLDSGANAEVRPEMLKEFGIMGSIYMEKVLDIQSPRVALINIGTEPTKGGPLQNEAFELLSQQKINFIGNVEARDFPYGACDVAVTDGFTGNVMLKLTEGVIGSLLGEIKGIFKTNTLTKVAAAMVQNRMREFKKHFDYTEYGGAPLLGISRPVIKAHGSSDSNAIKNAIRQSVSFADSEAIDMIRRMIHR